MPPPPAMRSVNDGFGLSFLVTAMSVSGAHDVFTRGDRMPWSEPPTTDIASHAVTDFAQNARAKLKLVL